MGTALKIFAVGVDKLHHDWYSSTNSKARNQEEETMATFTLKIDVTYEDAAELASMLGSQHTMAGPVNVTLEGREYGNAVCLGVRGPLHGIVAWLESRAISSEELLSDLKIAIDCGDLTIT